jgi:hypothetical protein
MSRGSSHDKDGKLARALIRGSNFVQFSKCSECHENSSIASSRLLDSGGIFTFTKGVYMEEISRSVRQAKQAKFLDADCTCPYSLYGDVVGPYHSMMW